MDAEDSAIGCLDFETDGDNNGVAEIESSQFEGIARVEGVLLRRNLIKEPCLFFQLRDGGGGGDFMKLKWITSASFVDGNLEDSCEHVVLAVTYSLKGKEEDQSIRLKLLRETKAHQRAKRLLSIIDELTRTKRIKMKNTIPLYKRKKCATTPIKKQLKTPSAAWKEDLNAVGSNVEREIFSPVMPWRKSRGHRVYRRAHLFNSSPRARRTYSRIKPLVSSSPKRSLPPYTARKSPRSSGVEVSKITPAQPPSVKPPGKLARALLSSPQRKDGKAEVAITRGARVQKNLSEKLKMVAKSPTASTFFSRLKQRAATKLAPPTSSSSPSPCSGMPNMGNTCYMNASIQSIAYLPAFVKELSGDLWRGIADKCDDPDGKLPLFTSLLRILECMASSSKNHSVVPAHLLRALKSSVASYDDRFASSSQQDAHEFVCAFLDMLNMELSQFAGMAARDLLRDSSSSSGRENVQSGNKGADRGGEDSAFGPLADALREYEASRDASVLEPFVEPISRSFSSAVGYNIRCQGCGYQREKVEYFRDFSLDIPANVATSSRAVTLESMLAQYFSQESLDLRCEKCNHVGAMCNFAIKELPRVLILHVKRFAMDPKRPGAYIKRNDSIRAPQTLDLGAHGKLSSCAVTSCKMDWRRDRVAKKRRIAEAEANDVAAGAECPSHLYTLKSVVHHQGLTAFRGHYTSSVRVGEGWWDVNDGTVRKREGEIGGAPLANGYLYVYNLVSDIKKYKTT